MSEWGGYRRDQCYPGRAGSFADHHVQLLQTFADQAVIAIENVRLFDEVRRRPKILPKSLQQQTATADVLKVISRSAVRPAAGPRTLVETAARLCEASSDCKRRRRVSTVYATHGTLPSPTCSTRLAVDRHAERVGRARVIDRTTSHITGCAADPEYNRSSRC